MGLQHHAHSFHLQQIVGKRKAFMRVAVAGAGGFIGGWLARRLSHEGHEVVCADIKPLSEWYQVHENSDNQVLDLSKYESCLSFVNGVDQVYNLAADMGGMGFIETHKAECMLSVLINTHLLMASRESSVNRFFFASSACVYNASKQDTNDVVGLKEEDAYPAMPEDGYGWEKLFSERMCRHFYEDYGLETRVARYHNIYGPEGTWDGGREKAPAALSRKVASAKLGGKNEIEIWGDGEQARSFTFIDDCIEGTMRLMNSDVREPLNIGSDEMVTINRLVEILEEIAGIQLLRRYNLDAPKGVRGRNSDNTRVRELLGWSPITGLEKGLGETYRWIESQVFSSMKPLT
jgi:nucleoside-diphosphate-sugar epimerase